MATVKTKILPVRLPRLLAKPIVLAILVCTIGIALLLLLPVEVFAESPQDVRTTTEEVGLFVGNNLLSFGAAVTGVAGWLLDYALEYLVFGMGRSLSDSGMGAAIDDLWIVIRDAANIIFIFGFVYIGIRTILEPENTPTKSFLAQLIIAALLINFSLFFTKVVVDVTNLLTLEIYELIDPDNDGQIGWAFAEQMGFATWYGEISDEQLAQLDDGGTVTFFLLGTLFLLVAAFVFIAAAIMVLVRFIGLVVIMIFSPILFAALVFPQTKKFARLLTNRLFSYALFAPIFIFMIYLSLRLLESQFIPGSDTTFASAYHEHNSEQNFAAVTLNFALAIGFLLGSLKIAQSMSIRGAGSAISMGQGMVKWGRGAAQGMAWRNSGGLLMDKWAQRLEKAGVSDTNLFSRIARAGATAKMGGSFSRQEVRQAGERAERVRARNREVKDISNAVRAGTGARATDNQRSAMERRVAGASTEQLVQMLKNKKLSGQQRDAIIANMSASQLDSVLKVKDEDLNDEKKAEIRQRRGESVQAGLRTAAQEAHQQNNPGANPLAADEALRRGAGKASVDQLAQMGPGRVAQLAGNLTPSQIDDIKKSTKFTETEKTRILNRHKADVVTRFTTNPTGFFAGMKDTDIAKLPKEILTQPAAIAQVSKNALDQMRNTLNDSDRQAIRNQINPGHPAYDWLNNTPQGQMF